MLKEVVVAVEEQLTAQVEPNELLRKLIGF